MAAHTDSTGAALLQRNPGQATAHAAPPSTGPWTNAHYFNVIGNLISFDQPLPSRSGHPDGDGSTSSPRPPNRPRRLSASSANESSDFVVLSRATIFDRKALLDDAKSHAQHQSLKRYPTNKYFSLALNSESGIDLVAAAPLKSGIKVSSKQAFGSRPISDEEKYLVAVHKKTFHNTDSHIQVRTFATVEYDTTSSSNTNGLGVTLALELELRWVIHPQLRGLSIQERTLRDSVVSRYFPEMGRSGGPHGKYRTSGTGQAPQAFYEAAHVTNKDDDEPDDLHVPGLTADLFPFQRRAVKWLLKREGVCWSSLNTDDHGTSDVLRSIIPYTAPADSALTSHFVAKKDIDGNTFFISGLLGAVTRDPYSFQQANDDACRGGILSEEMGLGKTVEMISLILLHPPPPIATLNLAHIENPKLGGTLIIAPSALKTQWVDEIRRHAPHLKVLVYNGMTKSCGSKAMEESVVEQFCTNDVVIATYTDLRSEIYFATSPPARNMRKRKLESDAEERYRPRSPLVQLSWWRVCLDEAQEIENGVSNVAALAHLIPRFNSWGVTGTPVKDNINDLWALLMFIRYQPYGTIQDIWKELVSNHRALFKTIFGRVALRHTKRLVRDELTIPPQKRFIIKMPFTAVEEQYYEGFFERLAHSCMLNTDGSPISDSWSPDDPGMLSTMQNSLSRLRMACLHPDLDGSQFKPMQQGNKVAPMRTVVEVLDAMIEQSEGALAVDYRALLSHKLKRGQLLENSPRAKEALAIWQDILEKCKVLVKDAREKVKIETQRASEANKASTSIARSNQDSENEDDDDQDNTTGGKLGDAQRELRYSLEILHKAEFFCANGYFQVKSNEEWTKPDSDEFKELEKKEVESYERAKLIRREILSESLTKATSFMEDLQGKAASQGFVEIPECQFAQPAGIESRRTGEELDRLALVLSNQAAQMDEWREALVQMLLKDLVDNDEEKDEAGKTVEITGDEYEDSTKVQDEIQVYITILKAGISDRKFLLTGVTRSILAFNEEYQAQRMAKNGEGPAPELTLKVFEERKLSISPPIEDGGGEPDLVRSLRACVVDLRESSTRLRDQQAAGGSSLNSVTSQRAAMELSCVEKQLKSVQREQTRQLKVVTDLEKELNKVRSSLNSRIAYYRQLQIVSDMVALYEGPKDDQTIDAMVREEQKLAQKLALAESKHRYLIHLKEIDSTEESHMCVICQSSFSVGVLTICGHQFCKECMNFWFAAHHNCPLCKRQLSRDNLHDITFKPRELKVVDDHSAHARQTTSNGQPSNSDGVASTNEPQIYEAFGKDKVAEIMDIDLPGQSFTTKVDTLVRHILWLRVSDPGAKSIVFSQYTPFLSILAAALDHYNISYTSYTERNGIDRFRTDPNVECFLLHARAHSSGLNLVVASHVLLCEPLLNTAIELQAIARVHRIGQMHKTTVWLFIIEGTVEESVHELSVERRMAHIGKQRQQLADADMHGNAKGKGKEKVIDLTSEASDEEMLDDRLELANSMELEQTKVKRLFGKDRSLGEEVDKNDLWMCLFGNRQQRDKTNDERLLMDTEFRRHLAANAAEERLEGGHFDNYA
ncbi:snf2 family helicase [Ophiostoma piceae UAMH 11346]|uniref:Snf2 family helicase n=1 Tax=Ophiostoma piceae (strain UAMH 11346) TaxID=1262450 RepID=S3CCD0_OPHP1|nr:snf2 family helicase [Ophiostoma piceae UAMH 11346]